MNIIILQDKDKIEENIYQIIDERFIHIKNILKSENGDILEVGLLNGPIGKAEIIEISDTVAKLRISELLEQSNSGQRINIICALPRPQTLKKVLSTVATMGVTNLYLIRSNKVEKSYFQSPLLEKENYSKYLTKGLSQGKRTILPEVTIHKRFKQFIIDNFSDGKDKSIKLLAHTNEDKYLNRFELIKQKEITIAIGPEGGWNDFEVSYMLENGFQQFKLSNSILRVENAVTAALAQLELINA